MLTPFFLLFMLSSECASFFSSDHHHHHQMRPNDYELSSAEQDEIFANTLKQLIGEKISAKKEKPLYSDVDHIVQSPVDDDDLELIRDYHHDFDKTGQLRFNSVPVVEEKLVQELLDVIFGRKEYARYLNNPDRAQMEVTIREMLRLPSQEVLQQQLLHKILATRAYFAKFIQPLIENDKRRKLLEFAEHLLQAHSNGTLSSNDTMQFNERMRNYAFFDRPDDDEFRQKVDQLQEVFAKSMNFTSVKPNNEKNRTFVPDTVDSWPDLDYEDENMEDEFSTTTLPSEISSTTAPLSTIQDVTTGVSEDSSTGRMLVGGVVEPVVTQLPEHSTTLNATLEAATSTTENPTTTTETTTATTTTTASTASIPVNVTEALFPLVQKNENEKKATGNSSFIEKA